MTGAFSPPPGCSRLFQPKNLFIGKYFHLLTFKNSFIKMKTSCLIMNERSKQDQQPVWLILCCIMKSLLWENSYHLSVIWWFVCLFVCVRFFIGSPNRHYSFSFDQVPETTFLLLFQFWAFKLLCLQTSMTCSLGPIFNLQNMSLFEFLARDTKDMIIFQFPPNDSH